MRHSTQAPNARPTASSGPVGRVVALSGGIGGAKLAFGLSQVLNDGDLMVVANTGDDFEHLGLYVSPDLDTLMYTLSHLEDPERGWGRRDETWRFMSALAELGGDTWFQLGDGDLATHVERTRRLGRDERLSEITRGFCQRLGVPAALVPMSDDPVRTRVRTDAGWLDFQDYFVRQRSEPVVREVAYAGCEAARAHPDILAALLDPALRAVVICPSNPLLSIEPILAVPGIRAALKQCPAPVIAVSPIIAKRAVKGPTVKMMSELGLDASAASVARRYADILDGYVLDQQDRAEAEACGVPVTLAKILMRTPQDKASLAGTVLRIADDLAGKSTEARRGQLRT